MRFLIGLTLLSMVSIAAAIQSRNDMPSVDDKEKLAVRCISLDQVHAIVPVEPMKDVRRTYAEARQNSPSARRLDDQLNELLRRPGAAPDLYLVRADSILTAVNWTSSLVLSGGRLVDRPVTLRPEEEPGPLWLVAHLGPGSSTPLRHITEIAIDNGQIIVRYERLHPNAVNTDWQHYFYWVPIGEVEDGEYSLVLWDSDRRAAIVTRSVEIGAAN